MNAPVTLPADACYWALVPPSSRPWTGERLRAALAPWVPSDVDRLDIAWCIADDRQVLIAAAEPERIDAILASCPELDSLTPDVIPPHVLAPGIAATDLHFLTGSRQPAAHRRLTRRSLIVASATATATIAALVVGAFRHHGAVADAAALRTAQAEAAISAALPAALAGSAGDPGERLDQARRMLAGLTKAVDVRNAATANLCTDILAGLPTDVRVQIHTLSLDDQRLTIIGAAGDVPAAQAMATAVATVIARQPGWRMLPLQTSQAADAAGIAFTCTAQRDGGGG